MQIFFVKLLDFLKLCIIFVSKFKTMIGTILSYVITAVISGVVAIFVYRNNHSEKGAELFDKVDGLKLDEKFNKLKDEIVTEVQELLEKK